MKKHIEGMTMEEYSKKQKREHLLTRLRKYYQSHLWCAFGTEILLALGVIILFMSSYMKNEYYEYLVETTMTTERVLLDSVSRNIRTQMEDFVNIGSGIAVDENLIEEIEQCLEKESEASKNKRMKNALESAASLSNHIVGMALADSDGVLCQYDKLEKCGNDDEIWTKNSQKEVQAAFQSVKEKSASKSVPRYETILYPTMHPNDKKSGLIHLAFPVKNESVYREIEYMLIITYRTAEAGRRKLYSGISGKQRGYPVSYPWKPLCREKDKHLCQSAVSDKSGGYLWKIWMETACGCG